jgi:hypothetical protein
VIEPPDPEAAVARELARKPAVQAEELTQREKSDLKLRERYANVLLIALAIQLFVADGVFFLYACFGVSWKISEPIIGAWLGAAVIQVVGVVLVVTKSLFPENRN